MKRKRLRIKILVIGEGPNHKEKSELGYTGVIGSELAALMDVNRKQYNSLVITRNLLSCYCGEWEGKLMLPADIAKRQAKLIEPLMKNRISILIGDRVARAFGYTGKHYERFGCWCESYPSPEHPVGFIKAIFRLPHPVYNKRWWNTTGNGAKAHAYLRTIARACMLK